MPTFKTIQKIETYLKKNRDRTVSVNEVCKSLSITYGSCRATLEYFVEDGRVKRTKGKHGNLYQWVAVAKPKKTLHRRLNAEKYAKFFVLVPVVFIAYVLLANSAPFGATHEYIIDVGTKQDMAQGDAYLSGPADRVSERMAIGDTDHRELLSGLVYFTAEIPWSKNTSTVNVQVRFRDGFPENQEFILGAKTGPGWNHSWKTIYSPFYEVLSSDAFGSLELDDEVIYSLNANLTEESSAVSVSEWVETEMPPGSTLASDIPIDLKEENQVEYEEGEVIVNTTLRGSHTFYTYAKGLFNMTLTKQDANWYDGADVLEINVFDSNESLVGSTMISDDGESAGTAEAGPLQEERFVIPGLSEGVYRIELRDLSEGADIRILELTLNQKKLAADKSLFIISPAEIYFKTERRMVIRFLTHHTESLQDLTLKGEDREEIVKITETGIWHDITVEPGAYIIHVPKGDVIIQANTYFSFSQDALFLPKRFEIVPLQYDLDWLKTNADFAAVPRVASAADGWKTAGTSWPVEDLFIEDGKAVFVFNIPHLTKEEHENATVAVDWIKIKVTKPAFWA